MDEQSSGDNILYKKLQASENENQKQRDEFDNQRAKMKELFLQKEAECRKLTSDIGIIKKELDEAKSQIVLAEYRTETTMHDNDRKAQEEIASLQHLIQETIDESTATKAELDKYHVAYEKLRLDYNELREVVAQQDTPTLAPVLSQVKKTLRKLGGDSSTPDHNLEDSMRKVNKYAQEDAEVLRSLVVPLEEEIKALKEKLRATDHELQKHGKVIEPQKSALVGLMNNSQSNAETAALDNQAPISSDKMMAAAATETTAIDVVPPCEMCHNYETHLIQSQNSLRDERQKIVNAEKSIGRLREELTREETLRQDLELQWQEKRELHKEEVQTLTLQLKKCEREFTELSRNFDDSKREINGHLVKLTEDREQVQRHLDILQRDNDILSGKYIAHSQALQNQEINLPNTVEELQEKLLSTHENLIEAKIGCEHAEQEMVTFRDESHLLRAQLREQQRESTARIHYLEEIFNNQKVELQKTLNVKEGFDKKEVEFKKVSAELREQVIELREANDKLEKTSTDLRQKMSVLQQDFSNSEAVQKDFVRLSQSLQMELEKIRAVDTQVRWQDEEDVDKCVSCKTIFTVTRRKHHCRHCGSIYCEKCLTKSVPSGPSKKPARVCDVCHTLLVRNTAPYFSQAPPHSPL